MALLRIKGKIAELINEIDTKSENEAKLQKMVYLNCNIFMLSLIIKIYVLLATTSAGLQRKDPDIKEMEK